MECNRVECLIELWLRGETTTAQERELRAFFTQSSSIPSHLEPYRVLFVGFAEMSKVQMLTPKGRITVSRTIWRYAMAVASVVVVAVAVSIYAFREPYCYINGKPIYDKAIAMQTTEYMANLETFGESIEFLKMFNVEND